MLKVLGLIFFLLFFFPQKTFAATINVANAPSSIAIETEFIIQFNAEGLNAGTYYGKVRIGKQGATLNKAETKNGEEWFQDSGDAWSKFPSFVVDGSGVISSGTLTARARNIAELGENVLYVRLNSGSNYDSAPVTIILEQSPSTPTPNPTPSSSASPTPTSTKTPTPKPSTPKPTSTPLATSISVSLAQDEEDTSESSVLSDSSVSAEPEVVQTSTPKPVDTKVASENNLQPIFIGAGIILLTGSGYLVFRSLRKNE